MRKSELKYSKKIEEVAMSGNTKTRKFALIYVFNEGKDEKYEIFKKTNRRKNIFISEKFF